MVVPLTGGHKIVFCGISCIQLCHLSLKSPSMLGRFYWMDYCAVTSHTMQFINAMLTIIWQIFMLALYISYNVWSPTSLSKFGEQTRPIFKVLEDTSNTKVREFPFIHNVMETPVNFYLLHTVSGLLFSYQRQGKSRNFFFQGKVRIFV